MSLIVYLFFNGNCEEAMNFYAEATGGKMLHKQHFGDAQMPTSEAYKGKVLHAAMDIMGSTVMFSDSSEERNATFGDNFSLSLDFKHDGDMHRIFEALSTGGTVTMPLQDTFWGAVFGMCTDKFGVNWMFNHDKPKS